MTLVDPYSKLLLNVGNNKVYAYPSATGKFCQILHLESILFFVDLTASESKNGESDDKLESSNFRFIVSLRLFW